jgi:hypothetical protein
LPNKLIARAGLALAALTVAAAPLVAQAQPHHRHKVYVCENAGRNARNTGTAVGAVAGGLLGNAVSHHSAGGTIVGAGVGAVAGHQIAKNNKHCHYEWRDD